MSGFIPTVRLSHWEAVQTLLLGANLAWTTLCLGGVRTETMVISSVLTAALLAAHAAAWLCGARGARAVEAATSVENTTRPGVHPAGFALLPFLAYAAVNVALRSPVPWLGWFDWFGWFQIAAIFWVAVNSLRRPASHAAIWTLLFIVSAIAVFLGGYQYFVRPDWMMLHRLQADQYAGRASGSFGVPNSFGGLLVLLLPVAAALACRRGAGAIARVLCGWLTLVLAFGLFTTISRGAWLALAAALVLWPLAASAHSWRRRLATAATVSIVLAALGAVVCSASPKVRDRLGHFVRDAGERSRPVLWRAAVAIAREHPAWGSGGGSFDVEFERHRPEGFLPAPQWTHNDYLNTLSDYGAAGFALAFGAVAAVTILTVRRRPSRQMERGGIAAVIDDPFVRRAQSVGLLAFALHLAAEFHLKIPALAMTVAAVAGLLVQRTWGFRSAGRRVLMVAAGGSVAAALLILLVFVPRFRAEACREAARERINLLVNEPADSARFTREITATLGALSRAVALAPDNAQAWADTAYARAQLARAAPARTAELGRLAEADADRALALATGVAEYWIRRGVARDMQGRWLDAGPDFTRAVALAPKAPLTWYHYAYHLALDKTGRDLSLAMVATCLRLDPNYSQGIRLRQQLATGHPGP